jgi:pSer/pThr/pTyr-binding forkhead associated (FHA) protein
MGASPFEAHRSTPAELRERIAAEREARPFLVYRDESGVQRIVPLGERPRVALGRSPECDICLRWDAEVSRLHAELVRVGDQWVLADDGLSSNGTFVAGRRVDGRRRLADGDMLQLGDVRLLFRDPGRSATSRTRMSGAGREAAAVTPSQRKVLIALCRPFKGGAEAMPASNAQIADELVLSIATVKTHLRALCAAFGIVDLPQHEKRRRLVAAAFAAGVVADRDL